MATFALVHGAWHGSWCWERLVTELEARGHRTIAMDVPSDDPEATFETYADIVAGHLEGDVILVGHSMAGPTIPLVPQRHPVRRLVYLCAIVPAPGVRVAEQLAGEDVLDHRYTEIRGELVSGGFSRWHDAAKAREFMYADCDAADAEWAIRRLRPQAHTPYGVPCSLTELPDVPSTYIVCRDDRLVRPEWSTAVAAPRAGAEVVELPGSHSPFLSRPADLAASLEGLA